VVAPSWEGQPGSDPPHLPDGWTPGEIVVQDGGADLGWRMP
jgi:hypothetical protein